MSGLLLLRKPSFVRCLSSRLGHVRHYALIGKPRASDEPRWALPKTPARTRFAPSPTGYLHLGSLRTALYNYLLAQATGGQFIIRLEDTDQTRLVSDAEQVLYDDLRWAGLHWDEGPDKGGPFGPYKQSERLDLYTQHANSLLESGHAFRCFCTKEDLEFNTQQATSSGAVAHYPGTCTHIEQGESDRRAANGEPHVVRFKAAEKPVPALDLVYGTYKKAEREDSFIIMKSDGFPTYHFANVVDDHFMKITHVIRGAEWLISTPKHVELYNALGWQPPNFAHVGLLVDGQRQKLSKRDMANIGIGVYRTNKVMPEALLNFSALLGWDPNLQQNTHLNKRGVMTLEEMKENVRPILFPFGPVFADHKQFTLKFTRGDIIVDLTKLKFFQKQLTRKLITGENPDRAALSKQLIQPILVEKKHLDQRLREYRQGGGSADTQQNELFDSISPIAVDSALTEDYVLQVLRAWKGPVDDPYHFLHDNLFAFYRPSKMVMRKRFHELQSNMARIMVLLSDRQTLINADVSKVLRMFTQKLKLVLEADWNAENLGDIVKKLTDSVKFYDTADGQDKYESPGWRFMRHALINGQAGSAIVPLMLLLGKAETIHRIRDARKVARVEEDKLRSAANRTHQKDMATKVRIRHRSDPRGEMAKLKAATSGYQDIEPRNVKIMEPVPKEKVPTPPGEGPFNIYLQKEKGRGEFQEGPLKSLPPTPPPLSPPRDPSEVERSPQFLSFFEFKYGHRHIDLPMKTEANGPAFGDIGELQRRQRAWNPRFQAPEKVQAYAQPRSQDDGWVVPKPRAIWPQANAPRSQKPGPPRGRGSSLAGASVDIDTHDHVKDVKEPGQPAIVERARRPGSATRTDPPVAALGLADGDSAVKETNAPRDTKPSESKIGPFKPAGAESPIDRGTHVKHLRALNRSLAFKRAAATRPGHRAEPTPIYTRLDQLKASGLSPMSRSSIIHDTAQTSDMSDDSYYPGYDSEQATASAPNHHQSAMRNEVDEFGVWGSSRELSYKATRQAAADWKASKNAQEQDEAYSAEIEKQIAKQWAERNR